MTTTETYPTVPRIRIEELSDLTEIGRGAAATVYGCIGPGGAPAALKLFNAVAADDAAADQYRRESGALERLPRHPAIIGLEGRGRAGDGRPFLVLELTDTSLRAMVDDDGPLPWPEATTMAVALAGALETAHRAGVVHCDVGPANIHRADGRWKLADFGAACDGRVDDHGQQAPFTLDHAAPEAIRGEPGAVSRDVYGLASTLFDALAGEAPFGEVRQASADDIAHRIASEPAPDLRPQGVPDAVCRVVEQALSKDPDRRPTTAAEFAADLAAAVEPLDVHLIPPLVLAPVTADLTVTGAVSGGPPAVAAAPPAPPRKQGRFVPVLVGVAAAALAVGAAVPVVGDAIDDGPGSLFLADQPAEVALAPTDGDEEPPDSAADAADDDGDADVAAPVPAPAPGGGVAAAAPAGGGGNGGAAPAAAAGNGGGNNNGGGGGGNNLGGGGGANGGGGGGNNLGGGGGANGGGGGNNNGGGGNNGPGGGPGN